MEQRVEVRKSAGLDAVVSCPRFGLFRGTIENLSIRGLYIRSDTVSMCLDVPVTITFQPEPGQPLLHCDVEGRVVHQDSAGFGVRLDPLKPESRKILNKLCARLPDMPTSYAWELAG